MGEGQEGTHTPDAPLSYATAGWEKMGQGGALPKIHVGLCDFFETDKAIKHSDGDFSKMYVKNWLGWEFKKPYMYVNA